MPMNYYNDNDPAACEWAKELIKAGLVPDGEVDCRSIKEVQPNDLKGFVQHHFFCGILGWPLALQLAGWPADRPVWTGSCPCQPFSAAGKRKGTQDERHLWPEFRRIIAECRPPTIFGEQVASRLGREWLSGVRADLEALGYAFGAADLCSAGVGAPNIRQRLYWVADSELQRTRQGDEQERPSEQRRDRPAKYGDDVRLEHSASNGWDEGRTEPGGRGDTCCDGLERRSCERRDDGAELQTAERTGGQWGQYDLILCRDGKTRRIPAGSESAFLGLAHGVTGGVDARRRAGFPLCEAFTGRNKLLKGFGNAINVYTAAAFVGAMEE